MTIPVAVPFLTTVPEYAHDVRSSADSGSLQGADDLFSRHGFSGDRGFVALEIVHECQAQVGGDDVTRDQLYDIARHQLGHNDALRFTIAQDDRTACNAGAQIGNGSLRGVLVEEAHADTQDDYKKNDQRVVTVVEEERQQSRHGQKNEKEIRKLPRKDGQDSRAALSQRISAVAFESGSGLFGRQTLGCRLEKMEDLLNRCDCTFTEVDGISGHHTSNGGRRSFVCMRSRRERATSRRRTAARAAESHPVLPTIVRFESHSRRRPTW